MSHNRRWNDALMNQYSIAAAVGLASAALYFLTRAQGWLSLALGSGVFAALAWWSSRGILRGKDSVDPSLKPNRDSEDGRPLAAQEFLAALPDAAVVVRSDGIVKLSNDIARDLLQIENGMDLRVAMRSPELASALSRVLAERSIAVAELRTGGSVERRLTARIAPLAGDRDSDDGILVTFRDRTSETQLDQMRSDFVANASHELRTPLASLKGFIETLQGAAENDPVARAQFLDIMQQEASRMSRLIDDLLSLSRVEMREHVPPLDRVDLRAVVREVEELLAPTAERASRSLTATVPDGDVVIRGEKDELVQVVQNLVQNAIKYGKTGGTVTVLLTTGDGRVNLRVADDGIGIAKEHIPRLTERFYRVNAKDSRERGGTGLGLAIVKHIVNRHRGRMDIASRLGQGTTVTLSFPLEIRNNTDISIN